MKKINNFFKAQRYKKYIRRFLSNIYYLRYCGFTLIYSSRENIIYIRNNPVYSGKFNLDTSILSINDKLDFDGCDIGSYELYKFNPKTREFRKLDVC